MKCDKCGHEHPAADYGPDGTPLGIDDEYLQREKWQLSPNGFYYSRIIDAPTLIEFRLTPDGGGWSPSLSQKQSPDEPNSRDDFVLLNTIKTRPQLRQLNAALKGTDA